MGDPGQVRTGIVLVNYNGHVDTMECLKSLELQGYGAHEVVVVDNGSHNESIEAVRSYIAKSAHTELLSLNENVGFAAGCNHGIRRLLSSGCDYVLVLNNDTLVHKGFLEKMLEAARQDRRIGIVTGKIYYANEKTLWYAGTKWGLFRYRHAGMGERDNGRYDKPGEVMMAPGCLMLVSRDVLEEVGLFDERFFFGWEDVYYCHVVRKSGYSIFYEPRATIEHKVGRSFRGSPQKLYNGYLGAQLYLRSVYGYGLIGKIGLKAFAVFAMMVLYSARLRRRIPQARFSEYRKAVSMATHKGQLPGFSRTTAWDCMHGLGGSNKE